MRRLLVTRGHQGSGKSTFIRELGLDPFRLCADDIRRLLASPVLTPHGRTGLSQAHDTRVWPMLFDILDERMGRGELVVLDATHPRARDLRRYVDLARRHRYDVACIDFSTVPLDVALARNAARPDWQVVPEASVRRTWEACQNGEVPLEIHRIFWAADRSHRAAIDAWLSIPTLDLSDYRRVHHIGDLQGCLSPLLEYLDGPDLDPDDFWILVGDLCDRGPENGAVVRWALDHALADNVRIHWGNHEDHLHRWATGQKAVSDEFAKHTLPQLRAAGLTPADVEPLCAALVDETRYTFDTAHVLVTHAGLSTVPAHPVRISSHQYAHAPAATPIPSTPSSTPTRPPAGGRSTATATGPGCRCTRQSAASTSKSRWSTADGCASPSSTARGGPPTA